MQDTLRANEINRLVHPDNLFFDICTLLECNTVYISPTHMSIMKLCFKTWDILNNTTAYKTHIHALSNKFIIPPSNTILIKYIQTSFRELMDKFVIFLCVLRTQSWCIVDDDLFYTTPNNRLYLRDQHKYQGLNTLKQYIPLVNNLHNIFDALPSSAYIFNVIKYGTHTLQSHLTDTLIMAGATMWYIAEHPIISADEIPCLYIVTPDIEYTKRMLMIYAPENVDMDKMLNYCVEFISPSTYD